MKEAPFYAKDLSLEAQTFLYACVFWTVAADEELKPGEQKWMIDQFGEDGAMRSLEEFVGLESQQFFNAFDNSAKSLPANDRTLIYPQLQQWLTSCAEADGQETPAETQIIEKIMDRLGIFPEKPSEPSKQETINAPAPASLETGESRMIEGHDSDVTSIDISSDGSLILSGSEDGTIKLWNLASNKKILSIPGDGTGITAVRFTRDNNILSGSRMGYTTLWNGKSGEKLWENHRKREGGITGIDVANDSDAVATGSDVGFITILNLKNGKKKSQFGKRSRGAIRSVRFGPNEKILVSCGDDKMIRMWDWKKSSELKQFEGHEDGVTGAELSSDGKLLVSSARDNTIRIWNTENGKIIHVLNGHSFSVGDACFSPDKKYILSGGWDHFMKLWDIETGKEILNVESTDGCFSSVAFHPKGTFIAGGGSDRVIHIVKIG